MKTFADKLNASSWRGVITEVGIGIPFSAEYMSIPGASRTILHMDSPYGGFGNPPTMRAVSLENAKRMADQNLLKASTHVGLTADSNQEHLFGLAITGAHYDKKASHAWVYLSTPKWDAHMHFYVPVLTDRIRLGYQVIDYVTWFLEQCFFPTTTSWAEKIIHAQINAIPRANIDVLYAPGVSDAERMLLLTASNPLAWNASGKLERVEDMVRAITTLYAGSFNPPTARHLKNADGALCEISQKHVYKGDVSIEDMLHRIRMLNAAHLPVLVTKTPRFIDKYLLLKRYIELSKERKINFLLGIDAWNTTIAAHQYPSHDWLGKNMPFASFTILPRADYRAETSPLARFIDHVFADEPAHEESSTAVRGSLQPHKHKFLTEEVSNYVRQHNLYAQQN